MFPTPLLRVHVCVPVQAASLGSPDCNFCESHALTYSTFAECYGAEAGFIPEVGFSCSLVERERVKPGWWLITCTTDSSRHANVSDCGRNCEGNHTLAQQRATAETLCVHC